MIAAFNKVGFKTLDLHINGLIKILLINKCRGLAYVGGFSHSDVLGAAHGWYLTVKNNIKINLELTRLWKEKTHLV